MFRASSECRSSLSKAGFANRLLEPSHSHLLGLAAWRLLRACFSRTLGESVIRNGPSRLFDAFANSVTLVCRPKMTPKIEIFLENDVQAEKNKFH